MNTILRRSLTAVCHISRKRPDILQLCRANVCQIVYSSFSHPVACSKLYPVFSMLPDNLRQPDRPCSSLVPSLHPPNSSGVVDAVSGEIAQGHTRLFAVVHLSGLQHKVTVGDLILIQNHLPPDVGERIRLEKVLLVGGDNFTLIGRPLLSLDKVRVEATIIEKTISEKKVVFKFRRRKRAAKYKEKYTDLTVLRINSIEVSPKLS